MHTSEIERVIRELDAIEARMRQLENSLWNIRDRLTGIVDPRRKRTDLGLRRENYADATK